jgi:hypothetical protein
MADMVVCLDIMIREVKNLFLNYSATSHIDTVREIMIKTCPLIRMNNSFFACLAHFILILVFSATNFFMFLKLNLILINL